MSFSRKIRRKQGDTRSGRTMQTLINRGALGDPALFALNTRCPECGRGSRVIASCEEFFAQKPEGDVKAQERLVAAHTALGGPDHYHLRCRACGAIGILGGIEYGQLGVGEEEP